MEIKWIKILPNSCAQLRAYLLCICWWLLCVLAECFNLIWSMACRKRATKTWSQHRAVDIYCAIHGGQTLRQICDISPVGCCVWNWLLIVQWPLLTDTWNAIRTVCSTACCVLYTNILYKSTFLQYPGGTWMPISELWIYIGRLSKCT